MADNRKKQNIVTAVIVVIAVLLAAVAILVKTGVIKSRQQEETTTETTEVETFVTVIVETSVDDEGNVHQYTMTDFYTKPSHSSNHRYPTTTKKTTATTTEKVDYFVEVTSVEEETDENGEPVTDENGEKVTKIVKKTIPSDENGSTTGTTTETTTETTSETTTKIVYVTDPISKKPIKNIKGEYIIKEIETEATTTKPSETSKTQASEKTSASTKAGEKTTASTKAGEKESTTAMPRTSDRETDKETTFVRPTVDLEPSSVSQQVISGTASSDKEQ